MAFDQRMAFDSNQTFYYVKTFDPIATINKSPKKRHKQITYCALYQFDMTWDAVD